MTTPNDDEAIDEQAWEAAALLHDEVAELLAAGRVDEAERKVNEAIAELARVVGEEHPDYANALDTAACIADVVGRPREAIDLGRRAVAIFDRYENEEVVQPMRAAAMGHLAYRLAQSGEYVEAERLARAVVAMTPEGIEATAHAWNNLGVCLRFAAKYDEARAAYEEAQRRIEQLGLPVPASLFHNLAGLACARDDFAAAETHARRAVAARANEPPDDFGLGTDLCGLGDALLGLGRAAEAESAYREGLACYERAGRMAHPEAAFALHNLGDALVARGRVKEAEETYLRALAAKERLYGEEHHEIAATLSNLAALLAETGRPAEARDRSRRAVAIARAKLPADHPIRTGIETLAKTLGAS